MYRAFYESSGGLLVLPLVTMFAFIAVWTLALVRAVRMRREPIRLEELSRMPLEDERTARPTVVPARSGDLPDV
jgi:hypothetical protein